MGNQSVHHSTGTNFLQCHWDHNFGHCEINLLKTVFFGASFLGLYLGVKGCEYATVDVLDMYYMNVHGLC